MASQEVDLKALVKHVQDLEHRLGLVEDINAIKKLHNAYGYYIDKCLYQQVVDLFAEDGAVIFNGAIFKGKKGVARLYIGEFQQMFTLGNNGPIKGLLLDHPQFQQIVTVADDRLTAKMRGRAVMFGGRHVLHPAEGPDREARDGRPWQWFEGGIYENKYTRKSVNDPWLIELQDYHPIFQGDYHEGWAYTRAGYIPFYTTTYPENPGGPDELLPDDKKWLWPDTHVVPFHYTHPVTGEQVPESNYRQATVAELVAKREGSKEKTYDSKQVQQTS